MKIHKALLAAVVTIFLVAGASAYVEAKSTSAPKLDLTKHDGGFWSVKKPQGWKVYTGGECGTFAFVLRDPSASLRQVLFFTAVGPVYMSQQQKMIDWQYMNSGGYPVPWIEMPVVDPLTPSNFLQQWYLIANTQVAQSFMPGCPTFENLQVVSSKPQSCSIPGGKTELVRAVFSANGKVGQGLFMVTVAPKLQYMGGPGGHIAYGLCVSGITAPINEFPKLEKTLVKSIESFYLNPSYVQNCIAQQAVAYEGILKAGQTLRESSEIINKAWQSKNKIEDASAQKFSDAILGKERLYDPETDKVYEFDNGFFDKYDLNRNRYNMNNLQLLPGNKHDLWLAPTLNGPKHIR